MKVYLTEEDKKEIEDSLYKIRIHNQDEYESCEDYNARKLELEQNFINDLLKSAIILPVYSNWEDVETFPPDNESQNKKTLELKNGVIIQPKQ
jgi:hypothetical protein